jgi:hypothetical protein
MTDELLVWLKHFPNVDFEGAEKTAGTIESILYARQVEFREIEDSSTRRLLYISQELAKWPNGNFGDEYLELTTIQGTFRAQVTRIAEIDRFISVMAPDKANVVSSSQDQPQDKP